MDVLEGQGEFEQLVAYLKPRPVENWPGVAPAPVRIINRVLSPVVGPAMVQKVLDGPRLHRDAQRRTGLSDFGDDEYREGFDLLLRSIHEEGHLTPLGLGMAVDAIEQALVSRLHLVEIRKQRPSLTTEPLRPALMVVGMPRTGTTALQRLLAQDPVAMSMPLWALFRPFPLATADQWRNGTAPGRLKQLRIDRFAKLFMAEFQRRHEMAPDLPDEEYLLFHAEFHSLDFGVRWPIPTYGEWLFQHDPTRAYAALRDTLRLIQEQREGDHWVLKSPSHCLSPFHMAATFPGASFVHLHRDPARSVPSCLSLFASAYAFGTWKFDPDAMTRQILKVLALGAQRTAQWRREDKNSQVLDLKYSDYVADPLASVRHIYDHFSFPWSTDLEKKLMSHQGEFKQHRKGEHHYKAADFGLDEGRLREVFGQWDQW